MIKREINLRPGDFVLPGKVRLARVITALTAVFFFIAMLSGVVFLHQYEANLVSSVEQLYLREKELQAGVRPLSSMEEEINSIYRKEEVLVRLSAGVVGWSDCLRDIRQAAGDNDVSVTGIIIRNDQNVSIDGESEKLSNVEHFAAALEDLAYLNNVFFRNMKLAPSDTAGSSDTAGNDDAAGNDVFSENNNIYYFYSIHGMLVPGKGVLD